MFGLKDCARLGSLYARRLAGVAARVCVVSSGAAAVVVIPNLFPFLDPTGLVSTFNTAGPIVEKGPFFESLGANGRKRSPCHLAQDAMGLSTRSVRETFVVTRGRDPLFAAVDGANCPGMTGTDAASHSLLLKNGLIRIPITLPANPGFQIRAVVDQI